MKTILSALLFSSLTALACDGGFLPSNNHAIPPGSLLANDMTEGQFKGAIKRFENFFGPRIEEEYDDELIVYHSWGSNTVNAYADKKKGKVEITVFGGLARHKAMNVDGLELVLCHELGHFFGGYPKKATNTWSSAEGQADYYGTMKCLRRLWENEDNELNEVPEYVRQECVKSWPSRKEQALCERMSLAGKSVALMIQALDHDSIEPKFHTPDELVVRTINYMHPFAQCRLDTFFQGALCPVSEKLEFENGDEAAGSCHPRNGDQLGVRPHCWFVHR